MNASRPCIAVVTRSWGGDSDSVALTRFIAGACALHGDVEVVHITPAQAVTVEVDSVFTVHTAPLEGAHPVRAEVAVAASTAGGAVIVPASVVALLERWEGDAPDVAQILEGISPHVVILAGGSQPYALDALGARSNGGPRVLFVPMSANDAERATSRFTEIAARSDVIGAIHPGEEESLREHFGSTTAVVALDVALPLNKSATAQGLFGVGWFGRYAVAIRRFPADGGRYAHSITHDVLRGALGSIAIAEVDGTKWRISDDQNTAELPVNPTRVNLWRLMANGIMTVDFRPPDRFGREALESMLLGTAVVVPDGSAAAAHVAAANGGLWYRDLGEAIDCARALLDTSTRTWLGRQGREYTETHHGDMGAFVARIGSLIAPD